MLGVKILDIGGAGAARQAVERRVAFAQGDGVLLEIGNVGKKFAEAPDSALVERMARGAAAEPKSLQGGRIEKR